MRDIRFRGLNHETGEWVYGWYTKLVEGIRRFDAIISEIDGEFTRFYIHHPETISQFTGLHDSKGRDIYEGDLCKHPNGHIAPVVWNESLYAFDFAMNQYVVDQEAGCVENGSVEVIGNIHEKTLDNIGSSA